MADSCVNVIKGKGSIIFPTENLFKTVNSFGGNDYFSCALMQERENTYANVFGETNCADEILCLSFNGSDLFQL